MDKQIVESGLLKFCRFYDPGKPVEEQDLKALLYGRYSYWNPYSPEEGFKDWYLETYYSKKKL